MTETSVKTTTETETPAAPPARTGAVSPFEALRREIDRLFDDFGGAGWPFLTRRALGGRGEMPLPGLEAWRMAPAVDLAETATGWELTAELPGIDEKDVSVTVANGMLTIRGAKEETREEKEKTYHLSERRYGTFQRSFRLPEGVDADRIEARFAKGVLSVALPKGAQAEAAKTIPVRSA